MRISLRRPSSALAIVISSTLPAAVPRCGLVAGAVRLPGSASSESTMRRRRPARGATATVPAQGANPPPLRGPGQRAQLSWAQPGRGVEAEVIGDAGPARETGGAGEHPVAEVVHQDETARQGRAEED